MAINVKGFKDSLLRSLPLIILDLCKYFRISNSVLLLENFFF